MSNGLRHFSAFKICSELGSHLRIAITGSNGFIGTHLKNRLDLKGVPYLSIPHDWTLDRIAKELVQFQADVVVHLASIFIAEHKSDDLTQLVQSNIGFGVIILEACRMAHVQRVIITGSSWQHFGEKGHIPTNLYGALKNGLESIAQYYADADDMRIAFLKLYDSFGKNDSRPKLVPFLLELAEKTNRGEDAALDLSEGNQIVDFMPVENSIDALLEAATWTGLPEALGCHSFRVTSREPMTLRKFVELFEAEAGVKLNIRWGQRPYRKREIMKPWTDSPEIPGFKPKISVREGLRNLLGKVE